MQCTPVAAEVLLEDEEDEDKVVVVVVLVISVDVEEESGAMFNTDLQQHHYNKLDKNSKCRSTSILGAFVVDIILQ